MKRIICLLTLIIGIVCSIDIHAQDCGCEAVAEDDYAMLPMASLTEAHMSSSSSAIEAYFLPRPQDSLIDININLIFLQRSDGTGNFVEGNEEYSTFWNDCINYLNYTYSHLKNSDSIGCHVDSNFISDVRINFVPHYFYVRDDYGWNNQHGGTRKSMLCPNANSWYLAYLDDSIRQSDIPKGINIYFTQDSTVYKLYTHDGNFTDTIQAETGACSLFPSFTNYNVSSMVHMPDVYSKYWKMKYYYPGSPEFPDKTWEDDIRGWEVRSVALSLAHELGHSFFLTHLNCSTAIMNPAGVPEKNFFKPKEVIKIYDALIGSSLRQYVPVETYVGSKNIDGEARLNSMRFYHSLYIDSTADVSMFRENIFPQKAQVIVRGNLHINGATLHSITDSWGGIVVKDGGSLVITGSSVTNYDIVVESGGLLKIEQSLTIAGSHAITLLPGSYFCVDASTQIVLQDESSYIKIHPGVEFFSPTPCNCLELSQLSYNGNGSILDFSEDVYIQNMQFVSDSYFGGNNIYVGWDVDSQRGSGDVVVQSGQLLLEGKQVILEGGTIVNSGAELVIDIVE